MDLLRQPPRRPSNTCIEGIVNLARMADKARASSDETLGEFVYGMASGLDETLLNFLGISEEDFTDAVGRYDDAALGKWVRKVSEKTDEEIEAFNSDLLSRVPRDPDAIQRLKDRLERFAPGSTDITTVIQSIELEDWGEYREADLTGRAPRSPYCRDVAGIYGVARMAEKGRAARAGTPGEYVFNCPIDQAILEFLGIAADDFQEAAYRNPNDLELGAWVLENTSVTPAEITAFNARISAKGPETEEQRAFFQKALDSAAPGRTDITTWFDLIDPDDEKSFGTVDLTRHAPRSPYDLSAGGIAGLARMIDKGRAALGGTLGDYWSCEDSGVDRGILGFLGISADDFRAALRECPTDADVLARLESAGEKTEAEVVGFNDGAFKAAPGDEKTRAYFRGLVAGLDPSRSDIVTWFGLMQLGDRIEFARIKAGV